MNTQDLKDKVTRAAYSVKFKAEKNAPQILLAVGIGGILTSTVLACRATLKAKDVMDIHKENIDHAHKAKEMRDRGDIDPETYTDEDYARDLINTYVRTGAECVKLYGPSFIVGGLSIFAICKSEGILHERNGVLAAAAAAEAREFKAYRERVADRFGEDIEEEIRYNMQDVTVRTETKNEDTGEITAVDEIVRKPVDLDRFSFFFDESCNAGIGSGDLWTKDPYMNRISLSMAAEHFNTLTRTRGYIFYNDIRKYFNKAPIPEGQIYGCIYDPDNSDWMIDFGIFNDTDDGLNRRFINGDEAVALLRFDNLRMIYYDLNDLSSKYSGNIRRDMYDFPPTC